MMVAHQAEAEYGLSAMEDVDENTVNSDGGSRFSGITVLDLLRTRGGPSLYVLGNND